MIPSYFFSCFVHILENSYVFMIGFVKLITCSLDFCTWIKARFLGKHVILETELMYVHSGQTIALSRYNSAVHFSQIEWPQFINKRGVW